MGCVVRFVVMGAAGVLMQYLDTYAASRNSTYLQAAGMLWDTCKKVPLLPKSDTIATKRRILKVFSPL